MDDIWYDCETHGLITTKRKLSILQRRKNNNVSGVTATMKLRYVHYDHFGPVFGMKKIELKKLINT